MVFFLLFFILVSECFATTPEELASLLAEANSKQEQDRILAENKKKITVELQRALAKSAEKIRTQGNYERSLLVSQLAVEIAIKLKDKTGEANALHLIGRVYLHQGDYDKTFDYFNKALGIRKQMKDTQAVASSYNSLGVLKRNQGDFSAAEEFYMKSLSLQEELGDKADQTVLARTLNNVGVFNVNVGNYELALHYYERSLKLAEQTNNQESVAVAYQNIGIVFRDQGNYASSLQYLLKALSLKELGGNHEELGQYLNETGVVHGFQGNYELALDYLQKGLAVHEKQGNKPGMAQVLSDIGVQHQSMGNLDLAVSYLKKSLTLRSTIENKPGLTQTLNTIGEIYAQQKKYAQALESFQTSKKIAEEIGTQREISRILSNIARVQCEQEKCTEALRTIQTATTRAREAGNPENLWVVLTDHGVILRRLGKLKEAASLFNEAIRTIEQLRGQILGGELEKTRFFENRIQPYLEMVDLLATQKKSAEALSYAERAKARVLLEVLQQGKASMTTTMSSEEQKEEEKINTKLFSLNTQIFQENLKPQPDTKRLETLRSQLEDARLDSDSFRTNLYAKYPELRVRRGESPAITTQELSKVVDPKTMVVEYAVLEKKLYVFSIRNGDVRTRAVPISREELAKMVQRFRTSLAQRDFTYRKDARRLYDLMVAPELQKFPTTSLLIIPDNVLWELPFQALVSADGKHVLEKRALSYAPSLTVLKEMKRLQKAATSELSTLLAFGNPDLGKATQEKLELVYRGQSLGPLPEAVKEVDGLRKIYGVEKSNIYVGREAVEQRAKSDASKFAILHFATHGILNDASPLYSQIVLSQTTEEASEDGLLEAWELMNLDLNSRLVILSACETARGKLRPGEGLIGLTWALFVAGNPTTIVSQWKVDSASTTQLMLEFHRQYGDLDKSPANALQQAALKVMRSKAYMHPFYWAGFVPVGNAFEN